MYNRLDTIPACDRRTDGRTDILPRHSPRYAYASRVKNTLFVCIRQAHSMLYIYDTSTLLAVQYPRRSDVDRQTRTLVFCECT